MNNIGFSERTFEFCFNLEFCMKNRGLIATNPWLPSQTQEKQLGYDVEFEISKGSFKKSLFLQHKVSNFASNRQHNNYHFYDKHGGPYYRFPVNNFQHNKMIQNALTMGEFFYCAPLFYTYKAFQSKYESKTIIDSSIWIDPNNTTITDRNRHNITYNPDGTQSYLHSDTQKLKVVQTESFKLVLKEREIDNNYVKKLADNLSSMVEDSHYEEKYSIIAQKSKSDVEKVQSILGNLFNISWILLP